jgi:hypothetical protein
VGVYDVRYFGIQNLANPASRHWVPHFPDVPGEAVKSVRLVLPPKGPVEIVHWETVDAHPIPILDDFARPWVQADNHHHMAAANQGFRQFSRRFFGTADKMGRIKRANYQDFHLTLLPVASGERSFPLSPLQ